MKYFLKDELNINEITILLLCLFISIFFFTKYWHRINLILSLKNFKNIQNVHKKNVPRIGGLLIINIYFLYLSISPEYSSIYLNLLLSFAPLFFVTVKEDLFQNTSERLRIFVMILSCLIFFNIDHTIFPFINLPILRIIYSNDYVLMCFFIFSSLIIINGSNLIDGMNGLFGFAILTQLIGIVFIAFKIDDVETLKLGIIFLFPIIVYLTFNYPLGRIFIGDLGAYFFGFSISMITIKLFGNNENLLSWNAVLILFYPSFELLFSFIRKIGFEKKHPLKADDLHLHTVIFKYGVANKVNPKIMNNLMVIILSPFWLSPLLVIYIYENLLLILLSLFILSTIYILTYIFFRFKI
jgi:UDP-N-acetylmuramyl pentapeptide phosphotransferase/UDP-N-acetylglucosamine-1-phosphate transferase